MDQKNALITGSSRGIGKATRKLFEDNGYVVYAPTRSDMDLSNSESIEEWCAKQRKVTFYTIINNAGINDINLLENVSDAEIYNMIQIDLAAPIRILRALIPSMKLAGEGRIVNVGSIWSVVSKSGRGLYSAVKNGIHGLTNSLALELAPYGILCNTVCPGFTLTELTKKNNTDLEIADISATIPLQRMASPEEIASLIYFLGSPQNTYITGQKITIDGGYTAK